MVLNCNSSTLTFCKKRHTLIHYTVGNTHTLRQRKGQKQKDSVYLGQILSGSGASAPETDSWLAPWTSLCVADWVQDGAPVQGRHRGTVSCVPQCTTIRLVDGMLQVQP